MQTLNLYKERQHSKIIVEDRQTKKPIEYKIPNEFTVEEVERLLELEILRSSIESETVENSSGIKSLEDKRLERFWNVIFDQLTILLAHFHEDMTTEKIKATFTYDNALEIIGFYKKYRLQEKPSQTTAKKKL